MKPKAITVIVILIQAIHSPAQHVVRMLNNYFEPATLNIQKGDSVKWVNETMVVHTSTSGKDCLKNGTWDSGNLNEGESFQMVFREDGNFPYFCIPHCLEMKGMIHVGKNSFQNGAMDEKTEPVTVFSATQIINSQTVETLRKRVLDIRITHRFDNISGPRGGFHNFYGLDNMRDVRIGADYGITNNLAIGLGRSKGDLFPPHQDIKELWDFFAKQRIIKQRKGLPVSATVFANTVYSSLVNNPVVTNFEGNFSNNSERFSFSTQVLIASQVANGLSFQLVPTYIRRNWAVAETEKDFFALGALGRFKFSRVLGIVLEYYLPVSGHNKELFSPPLSLGLEINTAGHVFHVNFTNSTGTIPNTFLPYSSESWADGGFRLGFTISRKFNL